MSELHLPDDFSQWPADPFALLGIAHDVSALEAKRAYGRLIRRFKPEHFPDQFCRIREAYEYVDRQIAARARQSSEPEDVMDRADIRDANAGGPSPAGTDSSIVSAAWDLACRGDLIAARDMLQRDSSQRAGSQAWRRYWLDSLIGQSEPPPIEWLTSQLRTTPVPPTAWELFQRKIKQHPQDAFSTPFENLLFARDLPEEVRFQIALLRWQAADAIGQPERLVEDLELLCPRFLGADERYWAKLLFQAVEILAWPDHGPCVAAFHECCAEVDEMQDLHSQYAQQFDRLDELAELREQVLALRRISAIPRHWIEAIVQFWKYPFQNEQIAAMRLLTEMAADPLSTLDTLDFLVNVSPLAAQLLSNFVHESWGRAIDGEPDLRETGHYTLLLQRFFHSRPDGFYATLRRDILELAVTLLVDPAIIAEYLARREVGRGELSETLAADGPLRISYWAYRAHHG